MISLDFGEVLQGALVIIVIAVLILIVMPYLSGKGRR
jgi:competence protein ComGC